MKDRGADSAEEQSCRSPEKEGGRKYSTGASPGINGRRGGEFRDQQDQNLNSAHLAAKDQFKVLVSETENSQTGNPDQNGGRADQHERSDPEL